MALRMKLPTSSTIGASKRCAPIRMISGVQVNARMSVPRASNCRRPAAAQRRTVVSRGYNRTGALKVVAFRDVHRAETLQSMAREFATAWAHCLCNGPTDKEHFATIMGPMCDPDVEVTSVHPMGCAKAKGVAALQAKLTRDHLGLSTQGSPGALKGGIQVLLTGADDAADVAFALLELPALHPTPAIGQASTAANEKSYMLLKFDIMLDDTVRKVMNVVERGQVAGGFDLPVKMQQQMDATKLQQQGCPRTPTFPNHMIKEWQMQGNKMTPAGPAPDAVEQVRESLKRWVEARSSASISGANMAMAGVNDNFVLYDGYGLMPMMCELGAQQEVVKGGSPTALNTCTFGKNQLVHMMDAVKAEYDVEARMLDVAVCLKEAAGFCHWKATHRNKKTGQTFDVEGMEVDLFDPQSGSLAGVYLFGDALEQEVEKLEKQMNKIIEEGKSNSA